MVLNGQPLTFRVRRPPPGQGIEVLEVEGVNTDFQVRSQFNAYLFFATANMFSPASCPEFFGTFSVNPHTGEATFQPKRVWRVALTGKLLALGKQDVSHIVVTMAPVGGGAPLSFSSAKIIHVDDPEI